MTKTYVQQWKSCLFFMLMWQQLHTSSLLFEEAFSVVYPIIRGLRGEPQMQSARCTRTTEKEEGTGESSFLLKLQIHMQSSTRSKKQNVHFLWDAVAVPALQLGFVTLFAEGASRSFSPITI